MADVVDEASRTIRQAIQSKVNRNNDNVVLISKKRRLQYSYYPPRKRARVESDDGSVEQHGNIKKASREKNNARTGLENFISDTSLNGNLNYASITKYGCKRYRRPMIRSPAGKAKKKSAPSRVEEASFRE